MALPHFRVLLLIAFCAYGLHAASLNSSSAPETPWMPVKPKVSALVSVSPPDAPHYQNGHAAMSQMRPKPKPITRGTYAPTAQASEPRSFQAGPDIGHDFPAPVVKHRENGGATVGLDLPDSNLRLLLDIDELASKPITENIKFKVIERGNGNGGSANQESKPTYSAPLRPQQPGPKYAGYRNNNGQQPTPTAASHHNAGPSNKPYNTQLPPGMSKQYKIGYIRASDLHTVIARGVGPANKLAHMPPAPRPSATHNKQVQTASGYQVKYSQPLPEQSPHNNNRNNQKYDQPTPIAAAAAQTNSYSKTNSKPAPPAPIKGNSYPPPSPLQREKSKTRDREQREQRDSGKTNSRPKADVQVSQKYDSDDAPPPPPSRRTTERPSTTTPSDKFTSDEQQKHVDVSDSDDNDDIELVKLQEQSNDDDGFGPSDDQQVDLVRASPPSSPPTAANLKKDDTRNEVEDNDFDEEDDFTIVKPFPGTTTSGITDSCAASCQATCMPSTRSINGDMDAMTVREFAARIKADAIFDVLPEIEDQLQNVLDFATTGYTMFLPSNDAVARLPKALIKSLKSNPDELRKLVENHVCDDKQTMKDVKSMITMKSRAASARLVVHKQQESMTVNGQRIVQMNQKGPMAGVVHVLDGLLYPLADKNIMKTLKSCNRFDGFVTLAEGTGIGDVLAGEGPFTLFVPSNEALQKIPDADLDRIRNNMTSLKEFLMYHVGHGSFYSGDLRDGQFMPSMLAGQEIQVGIRVDGCARRLVEANVSPLYRADIPASNGVIHVVDWILKPNDRDWCDGIILPRR